MNQMPGLCLPASQPGFTPKQGQYLAFIHAYTLVLGRPPAEADLQRFFQVTPPSVHQMVLTLERSGLIRRHRTAWPGGWRPYCLRVGCRVCADWGVSSRPADRVATEWARGWRYVLANIMVRGNSL
jgi:hypothetical protein